MYGESERGRDGVKGMNEGMTAAVQEKGKEGVREIFAEVKAICRERRKEVVRETGNHREIEEKQMEEMTKKSAKVREE